jgi:hypothetical protein
MLVTLPIPHPGAPTCPFTPKVLRAREFAPTHYSSVVFTSNSHLSLSKSLKAHQFEHPFYIQLLFLKNIGLHMQKQNWGFHTSEITYSCLLNNHLLSWDGILDKKIFH